LARFADSTDFRIIAIDPSSAELAIARALISDPRVTFVCGRAQETAQYVRQADAVFLCNVLHQIPKDERAGAFTDAFHVLKPNGTLAFNTLFYRGAIPEETRGFYVRWMVRTYAQLKRRGFATQAPRAVPVALQLLTPNEHCLMLQVAGFDDPIVEE